MFGRSRLGPPSSLNGYVLIVAVAGLAVLAAAAAQGWATFAHPSLALWVLVAMVLVTEVTPLSDHPLLPYVQSSSTSTPFVIAVLAQWGGAPAVIVGAASSLLDGRARHRPGGAGHLAALAAAHGRAGAGAAADPLRVPGGGRRAGAARRGRGGQR